MALIASDRDEDLVEAARAGDDRAFEELYARYRQQIRGFAHRLTHDHDRADDITQEVFISALRRLRETDRMIAFRPWIYEIARNACIDEHRRARRVQEVPIEHDGDAAWYPGVAGSPSPEVAIDSKQSLDDLRGAFRGLSDRHHRVIVLRELEGKSYSQIGDELGMSKMVVESTLFRARRRLSEEYEDLASGRRCAYVQRLLADRPSPRGLGVRDRRSLSNHLQHCRTCRREAYAAGWTDRTGQPRVVQRVAAFVPVPFLRLHARLVGLFHDAHNATAPAASTALPYMAPVGSLAATGRAAATAAGLIAAVVGGGIAGNTAESVIGVAATAPSAIVSVASAQSQGAGPHARAKALPGLGGSNQAWASMLTTPNGQPTSPFFAVPGPETGKTSLTASSAGPAVGAGRGANPGGAPPSQGSAAGAAAGSTAGAPVVPVGGGATGTLPAGDPGPATAATAGTGAGAAAGTGTGTATGTTAGAGSTAGSTAPAGGAGSTAGGAGATASGAGSGAASAGGAAATTGGAAGSAVRGAVGSAADTVPPASSKASGLAADTATTATSGASSVSAGSATSGGSGAISGGSPVSGGAAMPGAPAMPGASSTPGSVPSTGTSAPGGTSAPTPPGVPAGVGVPPLPRGAGGSPSGASATPATSSAS